MYAEAVSHYDKKEFDEAVDILKFIYENFPDNDWADASLYLIGDSYMKQSEYEQAIKYFDKIIQKYPDSPLISDALFFKGKCFYLQQKFSSMIDVFENFLIKFSESYWDFEILSMLKEVEEKEGKRVDIIFYNIALSLHEKGETSKAQKYYENIILNYTKSSFYNDALYMLGEINSKKGEFKKALNFYKKISENSDYYFRALYKIGEIKFNLSDYKDALSFFELVFEKSPSENRHKIIDSYYMYGESLLNLEKTEKALSFFNEFIEKYPDTEWTIKAEKIIERLKKDKPEEFIIDTDKFSSITSIAEREKRERIEKMAARIKARDKKEIEVHPVDIRENILNQANSKFENNLYFDALNLLSSVSEDSQNDPEIYLQLALLYNQMKDTETALEFVEKYLNYGGADNAVYNFYAYLMYKLNKMEETIDLYKKAYSLEELPRQKEELRLAIERVRFEN
ncbi:MAG: tetratricopeptide repeat protein [Candidatus Muiribacteriota bacterium]